MNEPMIDRPPLTITEWKDVQLCPNCLYAGTVRGRDIMFRVDNSEVILYLKCPCCGRACRASTDRDTAYAFYVPQELKDEIAEEVNKEKTDLIPECGYCQLI